MIIDTHIHLSHHLFRCEFPYLTRENGEFTVKSGVRAQVIAESTAAGVEACIEPAIDIDSNEKLLALAAQYPGFLYPAVGVHPTRTCRYHTVDEKGQKHERKLPLRRIADLAALAKRPGVVAVGETGLDYHHERRAQHRLRQKIWFIASLRIAHKNGLPVILHIRSAADDAIRLLQAHKKYLHGGVCHCFNGTPAQAAQYVSLGLSLGIGASLLQSGPGQQPLEQAVKETQIEFLLLETDGPFVKPDCPELPKKQRNKARNTSLILPAVAERIAGLKGLTPEEVTRVTAENAKRLFRL